MVRIRNQVGIEVLLSGTPLFSANCWELFWLLERHRDWPQTYCSHPARGAPGEHLQMWHYLQNNTSPHFFRELFRSLLNLSRAMIFPTHSDQLENQLRFYWGSFYFDMAAFLSWWVHKILWYEPFLWDLLGARVYQNGSIPNIRWLPSIREWFSL